MAETFSSHEVCKLAGITWRQLDYWTRTGVLTPSWRGVRGSGGKRRWTDADVYQARVVGLLMAWSTHADTGGAGRIARRVAQELGEMPAGSGYLVVGAGGDVAWARDGDELAERCRTNGPGCWVLDLAGVAAAERVPA